MSNHPLQSSSLISMSEINTEFGRSYNTQISLGSASTGGYGAINQNSSSRPDQSQPHRMSEFYGYNHKASSGHSYRFTAEHVNDTDACSDNRQVVTYYSSDYPLSIGSTLYLNSSLTIKANGADNWCKELDSGMIFRIYGDGIVDDMTECTIPIYIYTFSQTGANTISGACALPVGTHKTLYSSSSLLISGDYLYQDDQLTIPAHLGGEFPWYKLIGQTGYGGHTVFYIEYSGEIFDSSKC